MPASHLRHRKAMHVDRVQQLITDHYATIELDDTTRQALEAAIARNSRSSTRRPRSRSTTSPNNAANCSHNATRCCGPTYAGAVPLDQLKAEQDRIGGTLTHIDARLTQARANHAEAEAELADCLELTSDCHAVYRHAPDTVRRMFNRASFDKI